MTQSGFEPLTLKLFFSIFKVTTKGVPISLADRMDFDLNQMKFIHSIRDAEYSLGVDQRDNVPILVKQTMPTTKFVLKIILN